MFSYWWAIALLGIGTLIGCGLGYYAAIADQKGKIDKPKSNSGGVDKFFRYQYGINLAQKFISGPRK